MITPSSSNKNSVNNIFVKCADSTSWESTPLKPWFEQPFIKYPEASQYALVRFQDQFVKLYSVAPPAYLSITPDIDKDIENIKYFKNHLNPSINTPNTPFNQRGVYLGKDGDFHGTTLPGVFDRLYIDNNETDMEEDLFFPFSVKQSDEKKIKGVCGLYKTDKRGNSLMVTSDGMDVSSQVKKISTTKDAFDNNANFLDVRIPSTFISTSYDSQNWNRVKKVGKGDAFIGGYYLLHPSKYEEQMVTFNPIVFSMLFRMPYIRDPYLIEKKVDEPNKVALFNSAILYEILHGNILNQMGNYSMDMHYNLLTKIRDEDVGFLEFRNPVVKHASAKQTRQNSNFTVPLNDFNNSPMEYQQFFNFILFYLIYGTNTNMDYRQYVRFNSEYDDVLEFISFFTSFVSMKTFPVDMLAFNIVKAVRRFGGRKNIPASNDSQAAEDYFSNMIAMAENIIVSFPYAKIMTSYLYNSDMRMLSTNDMVQILLIMQHFKNDLSSSTLSLWTNLVNLSSSAVPSTPDDVIMKVIVTSEPFGGIFNSEPTANKKIYDAKIIIYNNEIKNIEKNINNYIKRIGRTDPAYRAQRVKVIDKKRELIKSLKITMVPSKLDVQKKSDNHGYLLKTTAEDGTVHILKKEESPGLPVIIGDISETSVLFLSTEELYNEIVSLKNIEISLMEKHADDNTLRELLYNLNYKYMELIEFIDLFDKTNNLLVHIEKIFGVLKKERDDSRPYRYVLNPSEEDKIALETKKRKVKEILKDTTI